MQAILSTVIFKNTVCRKAYLSKANLNSTLFTCKAVLQLWQQCFLLCVLYNCLGVGSVQDKNVCSSPSGNKIKINVGEPREKLNYNLLESQVKKSVGWRHPFRPCLIHNALIIINFVSSEFMNKTADTCHEMRTYVSAQSNQVHLIKLFFFCVERIQRVKSTVKYLFTCLGNCMWMPQQLWFTHLHSTYSLYWKWMWKARGSEGEIECKIH